MKNIICTFLILYFNSLYSQKTITTVSKKVEIPKLKNSIYLEFLGNSYGILSVNYERQFYIKNFQYLHFSSRIGVSATTRVQDSIPAYNIPMEVSALIGKSRRFIEFGLGYTPSIGKPVTSEVNNEIKKFDKVENIFYIRLGYRWIGKEDGLTYRVSPLLQLDTNPKISGNITFGFSLGKTW